MHLVKKSLYHLLKGTFSVNQLLFIASIVRISCNSYADQFASIVLVNIIHDHYMR